jgi:hypothetical protein
MPAHETPTVDEIDEALTWAALTPTRGDAWREWVDARLDDRLALSPAESPQDQAAPPQGSDHPHEDPRYSSATSPHPSTTPQSHPRA